MMYMYVCMYDDWCMRKQYFDIKVSWDFVNFAPLIYKKSFIFYELIILLMFILQSSN